MFRLLLLSCFMFLASGNVYDFKVDAIDGTKINLADYKGKKILIVNTASLCGNTPQYAALEELYKKYAGKLVIIGFPANNFAQQEPGSNEEIHAFCTKQYAVTFPMAAKISVKGADIHPLYKWLYEQSVAKHFEPAAVTWNFQKYLIDEKGNLAAVFAPKTLPNDPAVIAAIEK
ncbi:glutathione peroxidase [Chitinophaga costaii]|uniref:Glutathione peroxidase n=1 Tax=Chitinophaga costaii TaxID=1335309 RepID=A0A1C4A918_9BACT|nr:redoxin domain-containing protein [Chitinophaga costaii]PUZ26514.1 glutathione peroxidase [Chitinophaga costaii]SCB91214.1 glutathione peroxidase [Chitinophaga costaii]